MWLGTSGSFCLTPEFWLHSSLGGRAGYRARRLTFLRGQQKYSRISGQDQEAQARTHTHSHTQRCFPHPRATCKSILAPGKGKWILAERVECRQGLRSPAVHIRGWRLEKGRCCFCLVTANYEYFMEGWELVMFWKQINSIIYGCTQNWRSFVGCRIEAGTWNSRLWQTGRITHHLWKMAQTAEVTCKARVTCYGWFKMKPSIPLGKQACRKMENWIFYSLFTRCVILKSIATTFGCKSHICQDVRQKKNVFCLLSWRMIVSPVQLTFS